MRILIILLIIIAVLVAVAYPALRSRMGRSGRQTQVTDRDVRPPAHPAPQEAPPGSQPDRERKGQP